jgi:hypothetical protein
MMPRREVGEHGAGHERSSYADFLNLGPHPVLNSRHFPAPLQVAVGEEEPPGKAVFLSGLP